MNGVLLAAFICLIVSLVLGFIDLIYYSIIIFFICRPTEIYEDNIIATIGLIALAIFIAFVLLLAYHLMF